MKVKALLEKRGGLENLQAKLSPEALRIFNSATDDQWLSFPIEAEIYEAASHILYPYDPCRLRQLGYEVASLQLQGVYRFFLTIATVEYLIENVNQIWRTLFDSGSIRITHVTETGGCLEVGDLPDLTRVQREVMGGFLTAMLEMTNVKNVTVALDDSRSQVWKFLVRWERK